MYIFQKIVNEKKLILLENACFRCMFSIYIYIVIAVSLNKNYSRNLH